MPCLAAIDVGSNAIRLSTARLSPVGALIDTDFHRYAVRLGADVFGTGSIQPERAAALVRVFEDISTKMQRRGVECYRAVATAAMREAKNAEQVVRRIRRVTGIDIEIITGADESRLARLALSRSLGEVLPDTLLVDLGGGSLELHRAAARLGRSVPFGTVRLLERYPALLQPLARAQVLELRHLIHRDLSRRLDGVVTPLAVGTGGNLDVLARVLPAQCGLYAGIDVSRLAAFAARTAGVPPATRIERLGLRADRADLIIPAALVILAVVELFGVRRFVVPGTGLRESVLQELAERLTGAFCVEPALQRFGRRQRGWRAPAQMAERLFELLSPVHRLWPLARAPLLAAACLKDLGAVVDPAAPAAHSAYIIEQLSDLGLDARARRVAARAVLVAAGEKPDNGAEVHPEDRPVAEVLGGVLGLASLLVEHGGSRPHIDLTRTPAVLSAGLGRSLPRQSSAALQAAFGVQLRIC